MLPIIQRSPAQELVSATHSAHTIYEILSKPSKTQEDISSLMNNTNHLRMVVELPIWNDEDLTHIRNSIENAVAWLALSIPPEDEEPQPIATAHEYPWGDRQPTLEELENYLVILRNTKDKEINAQRLAANNTYFVYMGKQIACDPLSRSDIDGANGAILLTGQLPPYWPGGWKTMDNSYVPIANKADWISFYNAMYTQGLMNFSKAQTLKAQVATAETIEAIRAIVW